MVHSGAAPLRGRDCAVLLRERGHPSARVGCAVALLKRLLLLAPPSVFALADFVAPSADLKATFQLPIIGVKKNPQSPMYTQLGVLTKGTIIEVNVSELGMVTTGGKVVWGKYAQITNNPVSCTSR